MHVPTIIGGSLLSLAGAVWTLQGLGSTFVPTSFMTNATEWVLIGLVTVAIGGGVIMTGMKRR